MPTSPGAYRGITINAGTDAEVARQIAAIDAQNTPQAEATPATAYKTATIGPNTNYAADRTYNYLLNRSKKGALASIYSPEQAYQNKLKQYQQEIDATNKIYGQILADTQQQGLGRLGSGTAIQARSGLLGSDFGASQTNSINKANLDQENLVRQEQSAKIASIMGLARSEAVKELADKRAAQKQSAEDYLSYLSGAEERKAGKLSKIAGLLIQQGVSPKEIDPLQLKKIAKDYGVSVEDITTGYQTLKSEQEAAQAEAEAKGAFNLSEGQARYDAQGNLIASRAKTYAPKDGGLDITSSMTPKQVAIFNSLVDKQNKSPLIAANDRASILATTTNELENDTRNSALQVSFIYSLIQALDTYQSAVREGEIGLIGSTQGVYDQIANLPAKISGGSTLSDAKVRQYINVARTLKNSIESAATAKRNAFAKQAEIVGIGDAFNEYNNSVYTRNPSLGAKGFADYQAEFPNATPEEIQALMAEENNQ